MALIWQVECLDIMFAVFEPNNYPAYQRNRTERYLRVVLADLGIIRYHIHPPGCHRLLL